MFLLICISTNTVSAQDQSQLLDKVEERLHKVNEDWIYWPKGYPQEWMPDGSGYTVLLDEVKWRVDVVGGGQRKLTDNELAANIDARNVSPSDTSATVLGSDVAAAYRTLFDTAWADYDRFLA
ncbi:MAG: hypothetical protein AAF497_12610, partial [Planctomycetota bacterium]